MEEKMLEKIHEDLNNLTQLMLYDLTFKLAIETTDIEHIHSASRNELIKCLSEEVKNFSQKLHII